MEEDVIERISKLQASSIVPALDGILQQIQLDLNVPVITDKVIRPKSDRSDSLVASLILLVDRGCSESSEIEQKCILKISRSLGRWPWLLDFVFKFAQKGSGIQLSEFPQVTTCMMHAINAQESIHASNLYYLVLKVMAQMRERKDAVVLLKTIGMFAVSKIEEWLSGNEWQSAVLSKSNLKVPIYMPFLIQIACAFVEDEKIWGLHGGDIEIVKESKVTVGRVLSFFALALTNPVCLVSILQNKEDTLRGPGVVIKDNGVDESKGAYDALAVSTRLQSVLCLTDIVLKKYVTRRESYLHFDEIIRDEGDEKAVFSSLLAVRWKVSGMQLVVGLPSDFQTFQIPWNCKEALQILPLLIKDKRKDYVLSVSPLQALQALEVVRISRRKDEKMDMQESSSLLKYCRMLLDISLKGTLDRLKNGGRSLIDADAMNNFFSEVADLTTEIMADPVFTRIHYEHDQQNQDMGEQLNQEPNRPSYDSVQDPQVGELLALVSAKNEISHGAALGNDRDASGPPTKRKRIVPEKVKSNMGGVKSNISFLPTETHNDQKDSLSSVFSHKGRVIMPATFNMDSKTREALWAAYIEDKDRLVEMLGDSNYREWHDESQRPKNIKSRGLESAFDAVFGRCTAPEDFVEVVNGKIIDTESQSLIQYPNAPWLSVLSGILMLIVRMLRLLQGDDLNHFLNSLILKEEQNSIIKRALQATVPSYSRNMWSACCRTVERNPAAGVLLYLVPQIQEIFITYQFHTISILPAASLELVKLLSHQIEDRGSSTGKLKQAHPLSIASNIIMSCMTCPPLSGSSISPRAAAMIPDICIWGLDYQESIYYLSCCTWMVWQSLKKNRTKPSWLTSDIYNICQHPLLTAKLASKLQFLTHSLGRISSLLVENQELTVTDEDVLHMCSSLIGVMSLDIHESVKTDQGAETDENLGAIIRETNIHLNILSTLSAICNAFMEIATRFISAVGSKQGQVDLPNVAAFGTRIVWGLEVTHVCQTYLCILQIHDSGRNSIIIPERVLDPIRNLLIETEASLQHALQAIQGQQEIQADAYKAAIAGMESAPELFEHPSFSQDQHKSDKQAAGTHREENMKNEKPLTAYQKQKRLQRIKNPFVRAIVHEAGRGKNSNVDDDLSDLEDFIVADPDKDYGDFIKTHFPMPSDDEDPESETEDSAEIS
eukprot:jgi/Picsp_1/1229/NSC_04710-R1_hypothetical protein CHLNCDRAFT_135579 [Chlorella variabilis]